VKQVQEPEPGSTREGDDTGDPNEQPCRVRSFTDDNADPRDVSEPCDVFLDQSVSEDIVPGCLRGRDFDLDDNRPAGKDIVRKRKAIIRDPAVVKHIALPAKVNAEPHWAIT
jgi:hypothetical protein